MEPNELNEVFALQDDCLIAISEGKQIPAEKLRQLPPWRAVLIARVGESGYSGISDGTTIDELINEAVSARGQGKLNPIRVRNL